MNILRALSCLFGFGIGIAIGIEIGFDPDTDCNTDGPDPVGVLEQSLMHRDAPNNA